METYENRQKDHCHYFTCKTVLSHFRLSTVSTNATTAMTLTYIMFMLIISLIVVIMAAVHHHKEYAEIYASIQILISSIYLIFLIIDIHRIRKQQTTNRTQSNSIAIIKYGFINDPHSDIFYLKIGACVFILGILIHSSMLIIYEIAFFETDCESIVSLIFELLVPAFSMLQLVFVIKFSNIMIGRHIVLARFSIMHCIGTSISIGLYKIMSEVKESLLGSYYFRAVNLNCSGPAALELLYKNFAPYLYPFIIEFYILSAGIFTMIWFQIGKICDKVSSKDNHEIYIDCSASNRGLFLGFIFIAVAICFIILSYVTSIERDYIRVSFTVEEIFELVVFVVIACAVIIAFMQTSQLSINMQFTTKIDNVLLFIGVPGLLIQSILTIIPAIVKESPVMICLSITQIIQLFLQTSFIASRLKCFCENADQIKNKPGRQVVTFLAIANIGLWIFYAFSSHEGYSFYDNAAFYGSSTWKILLYSTLPFVMFYRFHSSVCLVYIWKHSYRSQESTNV